MSAAVRTIRRSFTVDGHRATLSVPIVAGAAMGCTMEWNRDHPPHLRGDALARYRKLRNAILQTVADEIGGAVAVLDVNADGSLTPTIIQPSSASEGTS